MYDIIMFNENIGCRKRQRKILYVRMNAYVRAVQGSQKVVGLVHMYIYIVSFSTNLHLCLNRILFLFE